MIEEHLQKYRSRGLLIDTNLLLLLFIGRISVDRIAGFKRTSGYSMEDYRLLVRLVDHFIQSGRIIVTPNILTEVSNLSNGLSGERLVEFHEIFSQFLAAATIAELYIPSASASTTPGFHPYGLADTGILLAAKGEYLVLTDDARFANFAGRSGVDVINFNHVREASWGI